MGRSLQQPGVDVENIPGIGFPAGGTLQEQGYLAIGPGMPGQIIIDDEHVSAPAHEIFADAGCGVGGDELQSRRILAAGDDNHGMAHGPLLFQFMQGLGHC